MKSKQEQFIFPEMMGTEQEFGLQVMYQGELDEPFHLAENLYDYLPDGLRVTDWDDV